MTTPVPWPSQLPQQPSAYSEKRKSIVVRTQPDQGPVKSRRRFTKAAMTGQMEFLLTIYEYEFLNYFYETQLLDGLVPMTFTHPWTQKAVNMTITEPPQCANQDALGVRVTFPVEFFPPAAEMPYIHASAAQQVAAFQQVFTGHPV